MGRILSGVQPTGNLHIGNYLGAIRNFVRLQADFESLFCVVDLHAITAPRQPSVFAREIREIACAYLAAGVDPNKSTIFIQSAITAHSELAWILNCFTPLGWLNRMTQFKEKAGKKRDKANLGLYAYPVLMAADILAYRATHVPVGEDQLQHLELTRDIATSFNHFYQEDFFPMPQPQVLKETARVMSLRDGTKKMSKSDESEFSRINLTDDSDTIAAKVRKAKTDPNPLPDSVDQLADRPEADNLVGLYAALTETTKAAVLEKFAGAQFSSFKPALAEVMVETFGPLGTEMRRWMSEPTEVDAILKEGNERARAIAEQTFREVRDIMGFISL